MKKEILILPLACDVGNKEYEKGDVELESLVSEWMNGRTKFISDTWARPFSHQKKDFLFGPDEIAERIIKVLTHRIFNFQSKKKLSEIVFKVRQNLLGEIKEHKTLKFFLLYNGGYRASPALNQQPLIFDPDQTELMLLYQIALLNKKILAFYNYGIEFVIVINNGVAKWVNDISVGDTENYANRLRRMIAYFGAENSVSVLIQSELGGFEPSFSCELSHSVSTFSDDEHLVVERFLGRRCSLKEAAYRSSLYNLAELKWAEELSPIIASKNGIAMRQIAHPDMLSFRPFPGGAIRIQNGTFGFQYQENTLLPKLITSKNVKEHDVKWVPYRFPWEHDKYCMNLNAHGLNNE